MKRAAVLLLLFACGKDLDQLRPFPCARDGTCPSQMLCVENVCEVWETCELVSARNTCTTPGTPRCAMLPEPVPSTSYTTVCIPPSGSLHVDDVCTTPLSSSPDACPAGSVCYNENIAGGAIEPTSHCRMFCSSDSDCTPFHRCILAFTGPGFAQIADGVCEPTCAAFGTCSETSHHCDAVEAFTGTGAGVLTCRSNGSVAAGGNCSTANCAPGLLCIPGIQPFQSVPTCRVPCDPSHLCASGTCETSAFTLDDGAGFCH